MASKKLTNMLNEFTTAYIEENHDLADKVIHQYLVSSVARLMEGKSLDCDDEDEDTNNADDKENKDDRENKDDKDDKAGKSGKKDEKTKTSTDE